MRHTRTAAARERQYRAGRARDLALRWLADNHPDEYRTLHRMARDEIDERRDRLHKLERELPAPKWDTSAPGAELIRTVMSAKYGTRVA